MSSRSSSSSHREVEHLQLFGESSDDFRRGSIKRVKMINFVTYSNCQVEPGPHLNVVIGPNGSGKSTIVCALALGLGGAPSLLGRAKDLGEFVRHGQETATLEIELAGGRDGSGRALPNCTIRRDFGRDNSSKWRVNGKSATKKEVDDKIASFHIQIDNLCQFLPQDKVSSFAALNQYDLLQETEKAAGGAEMLQQHLDLIQLRNREKTFETDMKEQERVLAELKAQNERDAHDVERLRTRLEAKLRLEKLLRKRPWLHFREKQAEALRLRDEVRVALQRFRQTEACLQPLVDLKASLTSALADLEREKQKYARQLGAIDGRYVQFEKQLHALEDKYMVLLQDHESIMNQRKRAETEQQTLRTNIQKLHARLQGLPSDESLTQSYRQTEGEMRECRAQMSEIDESLNTTLANMRHEIEVPLSQKQRELAQLTTEQGRRWQALKQRFPEAHSAAQFIKDATAKGQLHEHVYGPLIVELNVKHERHARYLEHFIAPSLKCAFICQNDHDQDFLFHEFKRQRFTGQIIFPTAEAPPNPGDLARYAGTGIETYLDQTFEAPPMVRRALLLNVPLHKILAGNEQAERSIQRIFDQFPQISTLVTPSTVFSQVSSRYDASVRSSKSEPLRETQILSPSVAAEQTTLIQQEIDRLMQMKEQRGAHLTQMNQNKRSAEGRYDSLREALNAINTQKNQAKATRNQIVALEHDLEQLSTQDFTAQFQSVKQKVTGVNRNRHTQINQLLDALQQFFQEQEKLDASTRRLIDMKSQLVEATNSERRARDLLAPAQRAVEHARRAYLSAKEVAQQHLQQAQNTAPLTDELQQEFASLPDTISELEKEIRLFQARAEQLRHGVSENIIQVYEQRTEEIRQRTQRLQQERNENKDAKDKMKSLEREWKDSLTQLTQQISDAFSAYMTEINCRGEVGFTQHEDYDKWGLEIRVSFRETTPIRPLSAAFHSGGERSVSTMLFLISLQKITRCPFRLVDEINQGMDPRNERMIFEQIVRSATLKDLPQYFLITPKLLPDLTFNDRMCVLCIFNGPQQLSIEDWIAASNKTISLAATTN